jgi:hypothetical protein
VATVTWDALAAGRLFLLDTMEFFIYFYHVLKDVSRMWWHLSRTWRAFRIGPPATDKGVVQGHAWWSGVYPSRGLAGGVSSGSPRLLISNNSDGLTCRGRLSVSVFVNKFTKSRGAVGRFDEPARERIAADPRVPSRTIRRVHVMPWATPIRRIGQTQRGGLEPGKGIAEVLRPFWRSP